MVNAINGQFLVSKDSFPVKPDPLAVGVHCTLTPVVPFSATPSQSPVTYSKRTSQSSHKTASNYMSPISSEMKPSTGPNVISFSCNICFETFKDNINLTSHLKTHAKENEDPYQCNFCGKTFAVPARLTRHYRTHTGEKPYQCEYCKKSFSVKENLSVHKRIHTKERPYKCEVCERAFEHSGKLHRHMRIHTGERPHKCNYCMKTFIQSGQLVIHLRTHTGEKPYVCKCCNKGFTCSKQLKVHTRTHTGEKPYACDICGKSFGYNHVLKLHQVSHYGEKVYKCTLCEQTFTSKKSMEGHIKMTHSDSNTNRSGQDDDLSSTSSASDKENITVSKSQVQIDEIRYSPEIKNPTSVSPKLHEEKMIVRQPKCFSDAVVISHSESSYYNDHIGPNNQDVNVALLAAVAASADRQEIFPHYHQTNSPKFDNFNPNYSLSYLQVASPSYSSSSQVSPSPKLEIIENPDDSPPYTLTEYNELKFTKSENTKASTSVILQVPFADGLTPPSSCSTSPIPSSPDLVDSCKDELSLPPRKRTKMILKSMEKDRLELEDTNFRYSSVIQYARASQIA